jgi:hypothetical protein
MGGGGSVIYKMTEWRRGRIGQEAARGSVATGRVGGSSITGAWERGSSHLNAGRGGGASRSGRVRGAMRDQATQGCAWAAARRALGSIGWLGRWVQVMDPWSITLCDE